ncbi:MAG: T9SS type A sorting domain-containing protein [Cyclobacteriaceae bacterium]|nr:T9SS type A sorting domain-containing protein [Cyclobacteriaceae bacterium SS2]
MRYLFTLLALSPLLLHAQLVVQSLQNDENANYRIAETEVDTILTLPFWDDFSTSKDSPDIYKWLYGSDVFVNATYGSNAPTYKVATLDGLNGLGGAHRPNNAFPGPADSLVTHSIDLSQLSAFDKNTVFLSFFWQAFGYGELPDVEDSLKVSFYADDSTWVEVWGTNGGLDKSSTDFQQQIIQVSGNRFFHKNFRIKFESIINRGGPFDTWHIDYVYLNKSRSANDIYHFDRSLSSPPTLLFSPYAEVPAHQFFNNPSQFLSAQNILASNLDNTPHPLDYYYKLKNLTTDETYLDASLGNGGEGAMLPLEQRLLSGPDFPTLATNSLDSQVFEATYYYNTGDKFLFEEVNGGDTVFLPVDLKVNDTIRQTYTLHNYYAYDDGIAEYSSGINVENGMLVVMYAVEEQDTLTHLDIHFPDINPNNPAGKVINIIVMNRLDQDIVRSQPYTIQLSSKRNGFTRIKLSTPLIVSDTFYIGYENTSNSLIGIGLDRNNVVASDFIYYNVLGSWIQNDELQGALMIRPVFQDGSEFVLSTPKPELNVHIYPNPTSGLVNLPKHDILTIYDFSGRFIRQHPYSSQLDLSDYPNGIYLLKLTIQGESVLKKVIVSH